MQDKYGTLHSQDETIGKIAEEYFLDLFTSSTTTPLSEFLPFVEQKVTPEMNQLLTREVTDSEIHGALMLIGADRAPRPDGFTTAFYQQFWSVIGEEVCSMVWRFFET